MIDYFTKSNPSMYFRKSQDAPLPNAPKKVEITIIEPSKPLWINPDAAPDSDSPDVPKKDKNIENIIRNISLN